MAMTRRRLGVLAHGATQVALALALVAGVNWLASRNPVPGLRGDWTRESVNTLHPDSAAVFESVTDPVELALFYAPIRGGDANQQAVVAAIARKADVLLQQASYLSPRIQAEAVDPVTNPDRASAVVRRTGLDPNEAIGNFVLVNARGRNVKIPFTQLASLDSQTGQLRFHGEDVLYKAVVEVTRPEERMVTFTQGFGELSPTRSDEGLQFSTLLDREAYRIGRVDVARGEAIRPETTVLALVRPLKDYDERTLARIGEYHREGGNLLVMVNAETPASNLRRFLDTQFQIDIRADNETLHDPRAAMRQFPDWMLVDANFSQHPISAPLAAADQKAQVILPRVRPITLLAPNVCDYLLTSNTGAWTDVRKPGHYPARKDEGEVLPGSDKQGFPLALAIDPKKSTHAPGAKPTAGRVVVFASGDMATSALLGTQTANAALLVNAIHWLAGKETEERIKPIAVRRPNLVLAADDDRLLFWLVVVLPGAAMLVLGALVFATRRG